MVFFLLVWARDMTNFVTKNLENTNAKHKLNIAILTIIRK